MFVLFRMLLVSTFIFTGSHSLQAWDQEDFSYKGAVLSHVHVPGRGYGSDHHKTNYPHLKKIGYNTVQLNTFVYMNHREYTRLLTESGPTMSEKNIETEIRNLKEAGFEVMLKPHVWIAWWNFDAQSWNKLGYHQDPRNQIHFKDPQKRAEWFSSYTDFIVSHAKLAERTQVDIFVIGTELRKMSRYTHHWTEIIDRVREVYSGKITYAAEGRNVFKVDFWDRLDYIGVDAYFSLYKKGELTISKLLNGWRKFEPRLRELSLEYGKKVIITEVGYKSIESTAIYPWKWEKQGKVSQEEQALAFEALSITFNKKPYLAGVFVWKYYADQDAYDEDYIESDFTPYQKKAETIISGWFRSPEEG